MKKAFLQLHIAVFLAGFTALLGKLIFLTEGLLVWYRLLLTVCLLGLYMVWRKQLNAIPTRELIKITGVGLVIALHWLTFYGSVKYGNISVALVCLSASGFFSALLEPWILRKRMDFFELFLGLLAILGIYIIFDFHPQYKTGIIFGLLGGMLSAVFPIFNKQLLNRHKPRILTFYELAGGFILLTMILPIYTTYFPAGYLVPSKTDWGWLLVLAVLCTILAFELQLNALKKISAFTANLTYNLEPIYGIILAFVFFGESKAFHPQFYVGLALILSVVVIQMLRLIHQSKRAGRNRPKSPVHL